MASGGEPASRDAQPSLGSAPTSETANATFVEDPDAAPWEVPLSASSWLTFVNACCISEGHTPDMPINIGVTFGYVATTSLKVGLTSSTKAAVEYAAATLRHDNWEVNIIEEVVKHFDLVQLEPLLHSFSVENRAKFEEILGRQLVDQAASVTELSEHVSELSVSAPLSHHVTPSSPLLPQTA